MVVFACNACGASVKKNQVEKHYMQQCRRCESLSCMDCGKDFWGEDYKMHNKCISEEAKYAAKGWEPKASANKGERKQEAWIESINQAVEGTTNVSPAVRELLNTLSQHSNIPRKKKKFLNFVGNSVRVRNPALVEEAWKVFEAAIAKPKEETAAANGNKKDEATDASQEAESTQEAADSEPSKKKKKKSKVEANAEEAVSEDATVEKKKSKREKKMERSKKKNKLTQNGSAPEENGVKKGKKRRQDDDEGEVEADEDPDAEESRISSKKRKVDSEPAVERLNATLDEDTLASAHASKKFDWTGVVLSLLGNRDDRELSLKKLRKKVVSEYECRGCEGKPNTSKEEIWAKLDKKLKKMPQVKVIRDSVKLVSV